MPPTEYLEKWSPRDRGLAESLFLHDQSFCPCGCGQPSKLAHDPETDGGRWKVLKTTCYARQAMDQDAAGDKDEPPGVIRYVVFDPDDDYIPIDERPRPADLTSSAGLPIP